MKKTGLLIAFICVHLALLKSSQNRILIKAAWKPRMRIPAGIGCATSTRLLFKYQLQRVSSIPVYLWLIVLKRSV
jgi:hypothetical protein